MGKNILQQSESWFYMDNGCVCVLCLFSVSKRVFLSMSCIILRFLVRECTSAAGRFEI